MAPKKRQRRASTSKAAEGPRAQAQEGPANAARDVEMVAAGSGMPQVNSEHLAAVERNIGVITEHPIFEGIASASPIAINKDGDSGYKAPRSAC